jgi:sulfite exporter TauE/SafE
VIAFLVPAFLLGALGSAHCVGMCGPIALAVPSARTSFLGRTGDALLLNGGRVVTYALLGALFGVFGRGVHLAGLQQGVSVVLGVIMLLVVIVPALFRKDLFAGAALGSIGALRGAMARNLRRTSPEGLMVTGLLNGLLPCGLVYLAIAGALVQDGAWNGALFMAAFGLGTWPALFAVRLGSTWITDHWRSALRRSQPYVFAIMGLLFILRGLGLGIPYVSPVIHDVPVGQQDCP